jgi:hypothetical protein
MNAISIVIMLKHDDFIHNLTIHDQLHGVFDIVIAYHGIHLLETSIFLACMQFYWISY